MKIVFLLLVLLGCGKAPEMPEYQQKSKEALEGKTEEEIKEIKYAETFRVQCSLRAVKGDMIDLKADPTDKFDWILNEDEMSLMRVLNYKIGEQEMAVVVKISKKPELQDVVNYKTPDQKEYYLENSPVVKITYRRGPKKMLTNGSVHDRNAYSEVTLYENIEESIFTFGSEVDDHVESEDFRCKLVTKINPNFSDQWKRVK